MSSDQLPLELMQIDVLESDKLQEDKETTNIDRIFQLFASHNYVGCLGAIKVAPANTKLAILKASCWTHLGINKDKARRMLKDIIAVEPKNPDAHLELGLSFYISGDFEESLEPLKAAFKFSKQSMIQALVCLDHAKSLLALFKHGKCNLRNSTFMTIFVIRSHCRVPSW